MTSMSLLPKINGADNGRGFGGREAASSLGMVAADGRLAPEAAAVTTWSGFSRRRSAGEQVLTNARIVGREFAFTGTVHVMGGRIVALDDGRSHVRSAVDFEGDLLLPGFVDVHTDNLERHLEPRPGVAWPGLAALIAHDRQMLAAGITTVLDSLCVGDQQRGCARRPGLLPETLEALRRAEADGLLRAQHFLHLRCEVSSDEVIPTFAAMADDPRLRLVSLMDHTPGQRQWADLAAWRRRYRDLSEEQLATIRTRRSAAPPGVAERGEIAQLCRQRGLTLASHDDTTADHIAEARALGVTVSEFPTTAEAARAARAAGMRVVMGAPNIVLGGSHSGNVSAREVLAAGLVDGLASDYVPTSLLQACFLLHELLGLGLPAAVAAVSAKPAAMLGLDDRGEISPGRRADMLRVRMCGSLPVVGAVWREGVLLG